MLSLATKFHIKKRARRFNKSSQVNYDQTVLDLQKENYSKCKIVFSWFFDFGSNNLNACALLPGIIIFNSEWAAHLTVFQNEEVLNAYRGTIGHELAHKDNDFIFWEFGTKNKKFVNWINEVHADFSGTEKSFASKRENEIRTLSYKKKCKEKKDRDSSGHPSWGRRIEYISKYDFNTELILRIAADVNCKNEILIKNVMNHYPSIELK